MTREFTIRKFIFSVIFWLMLINFIAKQCQSRNGFLVGGNGPENVLVYKGTPVCTLKIYSIVKVKN